MYGGGSSTTDELRQEQQAREQRIKSAQQEIQHGFAGFNPAFYEGRRQAFLGQALPQLGEQYNQARRNLATMLANRGLLQSGAAGQLQGSLQQELGKQKQLVAGQATDEANRLRAAVSDQQSQLLSQAISGLDPSLARSQALSSAGNIMAQSPAAQVGNMFGDWANIYLANRTLRERGRANDLTSQIVNSSNKQAFRTTN